MTIERVVIVGAGIAGLTLARELRRRGVDPLLLERGVQAASEATAKSAWMIRSDDDDPPTAALAERGAEIWRAGSLGTFHASGAFLVERDGPDDVADRVAGARGRGRFVARDGVVETSSALLALRPPAGRLRTGTEVSGVTREGRRLLVRARGDEIAAEVVVNAAGAWASAIGSLRLQPLKRHVVLVSGPRLPASEPFCWHLEEGFYFRPHEDGLLICACDEVPSAPGDSGVDAAAVDHALRLMRRLQPGLGEPRPIAAWSGQRTFAPDRRFVIGWDEALPGVFHLAGLGGHGITVAPAIAELAAQAIEAGPATALPPGLASFAPRPGRP